MTNAELIELYKQHAPDVIVAHDPDVYARRGDDDRYTVEANCGITSYVLLRNVSVEGVVVGFGRLLKWCDGGRFGLPTMGQIPKIMQGRA